jgi:hypothetical protein
MMHFRGCLGLRSPPSPGPPPARSQGHGLVRKYGRASEFLRFGAWTCDQLRPLRERIATRHVAGHSPNSGTGSRATTMEKRCPVPIREGRRARLCRIGLWASSLTGSVSSRRGCRPMRRRRPPRATTWSGKSAGCRQSAIAVPDIANPGPRREPGRCSGESAVRRYARCGIPPDRRLGSAPCVMGAWSATNLVRTFSAIGFMT